MKFRHFFNNIYNVIITHYSALKDSYLQNMFPQSHTGLKERLKEKCSFLSDLLLRSTEIDNIEGQ